MSIHPTAVIDPSAQVADDVSIGAYSIVGADVSIDSGTEIGPHVVIQGPTRIGKNNRIFQFNSIGEQPQDKKYAGEPTLLEIGDGNTVREFCTFNRGTTQDGGVTKVGNNNWIMAYVHLAHDVMIGDNCILANNTALAGHVHIGDWAILGGYTKIHQFCWVGSHAFCGFDSNVHQDVPPYVTAAGAPAVPRGINSEGLRRRDFSQEQIREIKQAYRNLYRSNLKLDEAREKIAEQAAKEDAIKPLLEFISQSNRGIVR